jgi:hypothetical protein
MYTRDIIRDFTTLPREVAELHVVKHIYIHGFSPNFISAFYSQHDPYIKMVIKARSCVTALKASSQDIHDDYASLLSASSSLNKRTGRDLNLIEEHEA